MDVSLWADIRRLTEVEGLSQCGISRRLHCSRRTIKKALAASTPPATRTAPRTSILDPYRARIEALIQQHPDLSAVRVHEEISQGPEGYRGCVRLVRSYVSRIRPHHIRVYQEVHYEAGQAMQVDWGNCGSIQIGRTKRSVSVFVAVLCYSRLLYIEFTLAQKKAEFYRAIANALAFFGGSPQQIIFDNLKAAVISGSGRHACLHPEFVALCGHFLMQPIACERRDPESKGVVEAAVRFVKRNALEGRREQFVTWNDYVRFAPYWRDQVANVRMHDSTHERPIDRFQSERLRLRHLPDIPFDSDEVISTVVTPHARVRFDSNRYSVPPQFVRKPVTLRASDTSLRVLHEGVEIARHERCYEKNRIFCLPDHQLAAIQMRRRKRSHEVDQEFDALGSEAREFHLQLLGQPVQASRHIRRLLGLVRIYGRGDVIAAIRLALEYQTYDAAYVETLLHQERRRRQLPTPTPLCPRRRELIDDIQLEESDPAEYDRFLEPPQET
jgi:transposase